MAKKNLGSERRGTQGARTPSTGFHTFTAPKPTAHDLAIERLARSIGPTDRPAHWKDDIDNGIITLPLPLLTKKFAELVRDGAETGVLHSVVVLPAFDTGEEREKRIVFRFSSNRVADDAKNSKAVLVKSYFLKSSQNVRRYFDLYDQVAGQTLLALQINADQPPVGYFTLFGKDEKISPPVGGMKLDDISTRPSKPNGRIPTEDPYMNISDLLKGHDLKKTFDQAHAATLPVRRNSISGPIANVSLDVDSALASSKRITIREFNSLYRGKNSDLKEDLRIAGALTVQTQEGESLFTLTAYEGPP